MIKKIIDEFIYEDSFIPSCHASTIVKGNNGNIIAAWFGGSMEGNDDVQIYVSIRENGSWSKPKCVSVMEPIPHWNPVLFNNDGQIMLFYKRGKKIPTWETMLTVSDDDGLNWSIPQRLCEFDEGGRGPVKNKPIYLMNGNIIAPASNEMGQWKCFVDISENKGNTWRQSEFIPMSNDQTFLIQPTLWEDDKGLHMLMRSNCRRIFKSDSQNGGKIWCEAYPIDILHNNSGLDLVKMQSGLLILACNPVESGRTPLCLLVSKDSGNLFENLLTLECDPGEYSYPSIISDGDMIYGAYTYKREKIKFYSAQIISE